jgi:hypothetical protein
MKKLIGFLGMLQLGVVFSVQAQVVITQQIPNSGLLQQEQVWNIQVNHIGTVPLLGFLEVVITDKRTGVVIYDGFSRQLLLNTGLNVLNYRDCAPNPPQIISGGSYFSNQYFPVGSYSICYRILNDANAKAQILANECTNFESAPLSPPVLVYPYNQSFITEKSPVFSWTPPAPIGMMNGLSYTYSIYPLEETQSTLEAVERNIPLYNQIASNPFLTLNAGNVKLLPSVPYAWRVIAKDINGNEVKSDAFKFTIMPDSVMQIINKEPFINVNADQTEIFKVHQGIIKLDYTNNLRDTLLTGRIESMADPKEKAYRFTLPLKGISNQISREINSLGRLKEGKLYRLIVTNSAGDKFVLRFIPKYYF